MSPITTSRWSDPHFEGWPRQWWYVKCWFFQHTLCRWKGHDYDLIDSYANTESAAETFECSRCGDCDEIIYY